MRLTPLLRPVMIAALATGLGATRGDDHNASVAVTLFTIGCVTSQADPEAIIAKANRRFQPLTDNAEMSLYLGNDRRGKAWRLPSGYGGRIVLTLNSETDVCAVWAEYADAAEVESQFRKVVTDLARPGTVAKVESDETLPTRAGTGRMLTMSVTDTKAKSGYLFTLIAGNATGALFSGKPIQVSMQMSKLPKGSIP